MKEFLVFELQPSHTYIHKPRIDTSAKTYLKHFASEKSIVGDCWRTEIHHWKFLYIKKRLEDAMQNVEFTLLSQFKFLFLNMAAKILPIMSVKCGLYSDWVSSLLLCLSNFWNSNLIFWVALFSRPPLGSCIGKKALQPSVAQVCWVLRRVVYGNREEYLFT